MQIVRGYFKDSRDNDSDRIVTESLDRSRTFDDRAVRSASGPTVFISHKHNDLPDLKGFLLYLTNHYNVVPYIDSMDRKLPDMTNAETALRIKSVIESCDRFILLATNNALKSKWCNWEVGIADKTKYSSHYMAVLPMYEIGSNKYEGNEYLGIYPYIDEDVDSKGNSILVVKYNTKEGRKKISLKDWLNKSNK